jgi:hypothetical protein
LIKPTAVIYKTPTNTQVQLPAATNITPSFTFPPTATSSLITETSITDPRTATVQALLTSAAFAQTQAAEVLLTPNITSTPFPTAVPSNTIEAVCACYGNIYNCDDFSTHNSAQRCYEYCISLGYGDVHRLDGDSDGSACEDLP